MLRLLKENYFAILCVLTVILIKLFFFPVYKIYDLDDMWSISIYYSLVNKFQDNPYIDVEWKFFPKIISYIYIYFLDIFGWTRQNAHILSSIFFVSATLVWYKILKALEFNKNIIFGFIFLMYIVEPYQSMQHARVDSFLFLIIALIFYLFIQKHYFISGILFFIGLDTHPAVLFVCFYILAYIYSYKNDVLTDKKQTIKNLIMLMAGSIIGASLFFYLNKPDEFITSISMGMENPSSLRNTIQIYFFETKYYRHIPELILVISSMFLFIKNKLYRKNIFVSAFFISCIIANFTVRRGNFHYIVFIYPSFILLMVYTSEYYNKLKLFLIVITILFVTQYTLVFLNYKDYPGEKRLYSILRKNVPQDYPVIGHYNYWYVFKEQGFLVYMEGLRVASKEEYKTAYFIGNGLNEDFLKTNPEYNCSYFSSFIFYKDENTVYKCTVEK